MWKTPLTISTRLDLEGIGSERIEFGPYGDRVFHYHKFEDLTESGEMLKNIGVSVVAQPGNGYGWVQYRGYCPFAKVPLGGNDGGNPDFPPGLGVVDDNPTIAMPNDTKAVVKDRGLFEILDYDKTNKTVEKMFRSKWQINAKRNVKNCPEMQDVGLKEYVDSLYGKTVILIGAGPSLVKNAKFLKKNKMIKVAMLHSLPFLDKEGIIPEFTVHTDALSADSVFVPKDTSGITLIANVIIAPSVIRKWKSGGGSVRFYGGVGQSKLSARVMEIAPTNSMVHPMGCSMSAALYIFDEIMNASNFILIGNDLCYSKEGNTHCFDGLEGNYNHNKAGIMTLPVQNPLTGEIYDTCYQFILYKHNIEIYTQRRMRTTNKRYINATEGGILMLNETMTLTQAIKELDYE